MKKNNKKSLLNIYDSKENSFKIVSLILALLIIIYHSYKLYYGPSTIKTDLLSLIFKNENTGSIVVNAFFVISGFMITYSIQKSKNIKEYLGKRFKRIFPALFLVIIFSALILPPVISNTAWIKYISNPSVYMSYIFDNLFLIKNTVYRIGDTFLNNPYPIAINGSIWYVKHQFFCYLYMIPLFIVFIKKDKKNEYFKYFFSFILIITIFTYSNSFMGIFRMMKENFGFIGIMNEIELLIKSTYYFSAGVFINIYKDKIMYDKKNILYALFILLFTFRTKLFPYFSLILLPYFIIYIGTFKSKIKIPDISYYIFLVGFPIQQTLTHYLNDKINIYGYIVLSLVFSIIGGYLIHFIIMKINQMFKVIRRTTKKESIV